MLLPQKVCGALWARTCNTQVKASSRTRALPLDPDMDLLIHPVCEIVLHVEKRQTSLDKAQGLPPGG